MSERRFLFLDGDVELLPPAEGTEREREPEAAAVEQFHLPGQHNQQAHGHRHRGQGGDWAPTGAPLGEATPGGKTPGDPAAVEGRYQDLIHQAKIDGSYAEGKTWYGDQHEAIGRRAADKDVDPQTFAGMVAATSPQMQWATKDGRLLNIDAAAKAVDVARAHPGMPGGQAARAVATPGMLRRSLGDAVDIYNGRPVGDVLHGPKTRSFYNNLSFVNATRGVTVDAHMAQAAAGNHNLPKGEVDKYVRGAGYNWTADRVRHVASRNGLTPAEAQSVIWSEWIGGQAATAAAVAAAAPGGWAPQGRPLPVDEEAGVAEVPFTDDQLAEIAAWIDQPLPATTAAAEAFHLPGKHDQRTHGRRWGRTVSERMRRSGGITIHRKSGYEPHAGMALSLYPERERKLALADMDSGTVRQYLDDNRDLLARPDHFLGGWLDRDTNTAYLDVSVLATTKSQAERLAREHHQLAYFDLASGEEHRVAAA